MSSFSASESSDSDDIHRKNHNLKKQIYRDYAHTDESSRSRSPKQKRMRSKYHSERSSVQKGRSTHIHDKDSLISKDLSVQDFKLKLSDESLTSASTSTLNKKNEEKRNCYGPALPQFFAQSAQKPPHKNNIASGSNLLESGNKDTVPNLEKPWSGDSKLSDSLEKNYEVYGPILPPSLTNKTTSRDIVKNVTHNSTVVGPQLPPGFKKINDISVEKMLSSSPAENTELPQDDESYGPLPPNMGTHSKTHLALEERALQLKIDNLQQSGKHRTIREEWMIELPEVHSRNLGLGPRQFRPNEAPDFSDRSSWTDTPQDKAKRKEGRHDKKVDLKKDAEIKEKLKYDREQEKISKKHRKRKGEKSLVEIHRANLKNKKKEDPTARRPFNREIDLKVNHFDETQKKAILKKAQLLDDRFSSGQSKFL